MRAFLSSPNTILPNPAASWLPILGYTKQVRQQSDEEPGSHDADGMLEVASAQSTVSHRLAVKLGSR